MKKIILVMCSLIVLATGLFSACEETAAPSKYDNWQARNDAFIDSIKAETGENYVQGVGDTKVTVPSDRMELGKLYAIEVQSGGTVSSRNYVYCKKIVDNPQGIRLLATTTASMYYRGTYINGEQFDANFEGYTALDQEIPLDADEMPWPTPFDEPADFTVNGLVDGAQWALQHARTGERWLLYIPYVVGYGVNDYTPLGSSNTILGCSVLTFDFVIGDIVED